jgi:hypothetical protein
MDWPTVGAIAGFLTFILLPVAWVLTLSETGGAILGGIVWFITWPRHRNRSKCYPFTLDDIPSGPLIHSCPPFCYQAKEIVHDGKEQSWNGSDNYGHVKRSSNGVLYEDVCSTGTLLKCT